MDYSKLIDSLTPEMIERFSEAVATGKWPDGNPLSEQQKESCIQAIMLYKARFSDSHDEPFSVTKEGQLVTGKKIRSEFQGLSANDKRNLGDSIEIKTQTDKDQ
ncbi:YeaC family protein [Kangiella sp. TOML190]|uniref:YeaC family protein n=1 Tax=Kangiella sp. TOML190 TaxID=2931351 RepID=UPI00203E3D7C|nr:DUF1315 family protein [Kangiella sp. TOML190]